MKFLIVLALVATSVYASEKSEGSKTTKRGVVSSYGAAAVAPAVLAAPHAVASLAYAAPAYSAHATYAHPALSYAAAPAYAAAVAPAYAAHPFGYASAAAYAPAAYGYGYNAGYAGHAGLAVAAPAYAGLGFRHGLNSLAYDHSTLNFGYGLGNHYAAFQGPIAALHAPGVRAHAGPAISVAAPVAYKAGYY